MIRFPRIPHILRLPCFPCFLGPSPLPDPLGTRVTERLVLKPIGPAHADDLWHLHRDPGVARWYGGTWSRGEAWESALYMERAWASEGVHKWIAHDRESGTLVGRGGLSYAEVDGARRLEIGWAVLERFWGLGYASEIGRAGLDLAFGDLRAEEVASFTETRNLRSRAVMERLGFHYAREIRHGGEPFVLYLIQRP
ncbi:MULTISPECIES: GNAT family N-acetyltransferase [Nocardiopsis]|uniref:GNAT family N-acetyltransferase n=1 Tax=Nocardiopsis sinuspersici TaxID=501010 RepID=A0A1V3C5U7_9ACTN|nr:MULTISPECIES: GNAT family N-acetyltransferase [Nocardiopsis]OOC55750.1 GNAT family N-acetyltransferase [Nocardiopsis sinuspersici]